MKIINIYPLHNLSREFNQDMHMYLTHLVEKYPEYADVAFRSPGYKILDNSLIELGGAIELTSLLKAADKICADEIILPDVFQKGPETLENVYASLETLKSFYPQKCPYKLMAVAQGRNEDEWVKCYNSLLKIPEIDVIGIPKVLAKFHPQGRPHFVNTYCQLDKKEHHLLGLWYSITELSEYDDPGAIRSCDSVLMSYMAKYNKSSMGTRPDGYTLNLENDIVDESEYQRLIEEGVQV